MPNFYSRTTGGFYNPTDHETMPPDAIPVPDELYATLFGAPNYGANIGADADGNPAIVVPAPTAAQIHAALRASARAALDSSDTTVVRCFSAGVAVPEAWDAYRAALRAIVNGSDAASTTLPRAPAYPSGT